MKRLYAVLVAFIAVIIMFTLRPIHQQQELYQQIPDPNPMRFHGKQMERLQQEEIQMVKAEAHKQYVRK